MKSKVFSKSAVVRRMWLVCGVIAGLVLGAGGGASHRGSAVNAGGLPTSEMPFGVTIDYLVTFYPVWFTYYQSTHAPANRLVGPDRMSPLFHEVVAPNDDTLYVSSFMDLRTQPQILTIPDTEVTWSLLTMDYYGQVFKTQIVEGTPGTYGLVRRGAGARLPNGVTRIEVPNDFSIWIIRADKFSHTNEDQRAEAEIFRGSLRLASLAEFKRDPLAGRAATVPVALYATPYKVLADVLIATDAITFLRQLQAAVHSPKTPRLTLADRLLSERFDRLFGDGRFRPNSRSNITKRAAFIAGAQSAHALIVESYLAHTDATNWVFFNDIGAWGNNYLNRCATTQYLQLSNTFDTSVYFQAFKDHEGEPLTGDHPGGYTLTFTSAEIPETTRFWSLTMYTPESITLVDNAANTYLVGSYTPGLVFGMDGSLTLFISPDPPADPLLKANWLPCPRTGQFNVVLRAYGPTGNVSTGTYVPPGIVCVGD